MAITKSSSDTKKSEQVIFNDTYDTDFDIVGTEVLGYDPDADVLRRIRVDTNGKLVTTL
jgi:hypothetical protein